MLGGNLLLPFTKNKIPAVTGFNETFFTVSIIGIAFFVVVLYVFLSASNYRAIREQELKSHEAILDQFTAETEGFILSREALLIVLADAIKEKDSAGAINAIDVFFSRYPEFISVSIVSEQGKQLVKRSRFVTYTAGDLLDISQKPVFQNARQDSFYIGSVYLSLGSIPTTEIGTAIRGISGTTNGVIVAELDVRKLWDIIIAITSGQNVTPYLIDGKGTLAAHPDFQYVLSRVNLSQRNIIAAIRNSIRDKQAFIVSGEYANEQNIESFSVGKPLLFGWGAVVESPRSEFFRSSLAAFRLNTIISIISTILVILLFWISRLFWKLYYILNIERKRLAEVNVKLDEYLKENLESAKLLVRRDRELTATNEELVIRSAELNETAKILVRRDIELTEANERLQKLDQEKSDFVSIAAHQLRTPLTEIKWTIYTLLEGVIGDLNSQQRQFAWDAFQAVERIIVTIKDLLDVARLEEGRTGYNFQRQSILPVLNTAFERVKKTATDKGLTIIINLPPYIEVPLADLDEEKMLIVFDNLLDNAVKYTPPGGKVELFLTVAEPNLRVEVKDTGIGIPKEQLNRVFSKFFRADNAELFQTSGTGLGLYLTKTIVEQHNGSISFKSIEDKGTTFLVNIPYFKGPEN